MQRKKWDVFISHASEDKDDFTDEIVNILEYFGIKVWYDSNILSVGDSLSKSIDAGLLYSKYGIIVLSENFVNKGWPEYEFRSLLNREIGNKKVLLPIWHNIKKETIEKYSPYLLEKYALDSSKQTAEQIVINLIRVIKPCTYKNINREIMWRKIKAEGKIINVNRSQILIDDKIRHKSLPKHLMLRITNLYYSVFREINNDFEEVVNNFRQDSHPQDEVAIWEFISFCYHKYSIENLDFNNKKDILYQLLLFSVGNLNKIDEISDEICIKLMLIWKEYFRIFLK